MKTKSLIILGGVLVAATVAVIVKMRSNAETFSGKASEVGQILLTDVPMENVGSFLINDGKTSVEVASKDGKWVIPARDNFEASVTAVNEFNDTAFNLKVQGVEKGVGKSQYGRLGLAEAGGEAKGEEIGKTVVFKDSAGKDMGSIVVGRIQEVKAATPAFDVSGPQPRPQWIQVKGQDVIYKTATGFSKLDADPKNWLDKEKFFKIEKLKSIAVTGPTPEESWKISRETESGALKLDDAKEGEEFDPSKASSQGSAFGYTSFDDILPAAEKDKAALDKPTQTVVITTFEGLTYTIKVGAKVPPPPPPEVTDPASPPPTPPEAYYVSYTVEGQYSETPPPYATPAPVVPPAPVAPAEPAADASEEDKKKHEEAKKTHETAVKNHETAVKNHETAVKAWEEGKKKAEETFKTELEEKKKKLAAEQALQTRIFVVQKSSLEPIMKKRTEFMKDKPPPPTEGTANTPGSATTPAISADSIVPKLTPGSTPPRPGGKIEAVTPPIEVIIPPKEGAAKEGDKKTDPKKPAEKKDTKKKPK